MGNEASVGVVLEVTIENSINGTVLSTGYDGLEISIFYRPGANTETCERDPSVRRCEAHFPSHGDQTETTH